MTILITGGTGLVGKRLIEKLKERGHTVAVLSRQKKNLPGVKVYTWNVEKHLVDPEAIQGADCIVHLAGESILDKRWTKQQKRKIIDSRVNSGNLIYERVRPSRKDLKTFISASAIGYYGSVTTEKIFTEDDPPAKDFLGTCCQKWEQMADRFQNLGVRTVKIRTSPVLSANGGVLLQLVVPVKLGVGAPIGSGRQYFPWIHIDDLCDIYIRAVEDEQIKGVYNAAALEQPTNESLMKKIARHLQKPFWFPKVPAFIIRLVLGEKGRAALRGSRVSNDKITQAGFTFQFPDLDGALENLLKKPDMGVLKET